MIAVLAASGAAVAADAPDEPPRCLGSDRGETRAVTKVLDGETLELDDGSEVRLAGMLSPRRPLTSKSDADWPLEQQAIAALTDLVLGRSVMLVTAGRKSDRYGRRIAHALVAKDGRRLWVQGELLSRGYARAYALAGTTHCLAAMLARERPAREARLGLWDNAAYAVRRAWRTRELSSLRSTFQIVEGRVVAVSERGGTVYVNFGSDWKSDFTAGLRRRRADADAGKTPALDWKSLEGKRVRVRGWIERRNGPFVELAHPGAIERLDRPEPMPDAPDTVGDETPPNERRPVAKPGALDL